MVRTVSCRVTPDLEHAAIRGGDWPLQYGIQKLNGVTVHGSKNINSGLGPNVKIWSDLKHFFVCLVSYIVS